MNKVLKRFLKIQVLVLFGAFVLRFLTATTLSALGGAQSVNALQAGDIGGLATGAGLAIGLAGLGAGVGMGRA